MAVRKKLLFDDGWRFHRGDIHRPPLMNYMATYHGASAESGRGGAAAAYDDSDWERVDLPHDMVIGVEPDPSENEDHGYVRRDNGWYRNYFYLPPGEEGKKLSLLFDGAATECIVWVNGVELRRNFTAGTGFEVDFTDVARYGDEINVVSVYIDNTTFEGWYYEGGGLYRHVWLLSRDPLGIGTWGLFVRPEPMERGDWQARVEIELQNDRYEAADVTLSLSVLDPMGETAAVSESSLRIEARESRTVHQRVWLAKPALWSPENPRLYTLRAVVGDASRAVVDEDSVRFGIRRIDFDPDRGMLINGQPTRLRGMCVHQEHGGLGVAIPDGVLEYRVRRLQEMGCNAIRTAHNPPAPQLLDICDRLGMLIMEENRWLDSAPEGMRQLEAMIRRDRNHPCVIMWSMFNEEGAMEFAFGPKIMNAMRARARQLDDSRPVTYAQNTGLLLPGVARTGDVIGINYNNDWYPKLHEMYPDMMLYGSETIGYMSVMGPGALYLSYITGNVTNLRMPATIGTINSLGIEPNTDECHTLAILACGASVITSIAVVLIGVLLSAPLQPVIQAPVLKPAFDYVVPALFGGLVAQTVLKSKKDALYYLIPLAVCLFFCYFTKVSPAYYMLIAIAISAAVYVLDYKRNK